MEQELQTGLDNLAKADFIVDYIITQNFEIVNRILEKFLKIKEGS